MKRFTVCLALLIISAPAATAAAKEPVRAKVCGANDCREVKDRQALLALVEGGAPTDPPGAGAPRYRARVTVRAEDERFTFPLVIVPSEGLLRGGTEAEGYTWMPVSDYAVRQYRRITRGLEPFVPAAGDTASDDGGTPLWPWLVFGIPALALVALAVVRFRRRPRPGPARPAEG
jgi:hypothetical protein